MKIKNIFNGNYAYSAWHRITSDYRDIRAAGKKGVSGVQKQRKKHDSMYVQSDYSVLNKVFGSLSLTESDVFVDIGCGAGRVISYITLKKIPCRVIGIEREKEIAESTADYFKKQPRVRIICADATIALPSESTVFYLYCPMDVKTLEALAQCIENSVDHSIKLIYVNGESANVFRCRDGWKLDRSENIDRRYAEPVHCSVFTYMP